MSEQYLNLSLMPSVPSKNQKPPSAVIRALETSPAIKEVCSIATNFSYFEKGFFSVDNNRFGRRDATVTNTEITPIYEEKVLRMLRDDRALVITENVLDKLNKIINNDTEFLFDLRDSFKFIFVTSFPRNGGTYLTNELYRVVGYDIQKHPAFFYHDGLPDIRRTKIYDGVTESENGQPTYFNREAQIAEWLAMVDFFFEGHPVHDGLITIPKKTTKMVYDARFMADLFKQSAEWICTIRHPAASALSTIKMAGGLPKDGKFPEVGRTVIESWVVQSLLQDGLSRKDIHSMPYFEAFLSYWVRYHQHMAVSGLFDGGHTLTILPYTRESYMNYMNKLHWRFNSGLSATALKVHGEVKDAFPLWVKQGRVAIERMSDLWASFGKELPIDDVMLCI